MLAIVTAWIPAALLPTTALASVVESRTATSSDDAEEFAGGTVYLTSSDLELVTDGSTVQTVGIRWPGLAIPPGAIITSAYIQFGSKEDQSTATSLEIRGQDVANPASFVATAGDITTRPRTAASVSWSPVPWLVGEVGPNQRTPDLSPLIQEIVNLPGWASGNALAIIIAGTGHRTAWAFDGNPQSSPLLHVEFTPAGAGTPPTAGLSVAQLSSPALTVRADGSTSNAGSAAIATYRFDFGDGTAAVTTTAPTATAQHTYAAAGTYTVSLVVTDTNGLSSSPATASITVTPPASGPTARLTVTQLSSPALTARADGSTSTAGSAAIASYRFDFGDGTAAVTTTAPTATAQHTYAATGTYTVTLVVTDTNGLSSSPATASLNLGTGTSSTALEARVAASSDDAEEFASGVTYLTSSDLELVFDTSIQTVGMRWPNLAIPPGATITSAYIQFSAKESQSEATSLTFRAQAADNAPTFAAVNFDISTRPRSAASMGWAPVAWVAGEAGPNQRTPDLSPVIQEIVRRPGWASGNALAIIVTGSGHRTAWSYDVNPPGAALLHVEYATGGMSTPPTARLSVAQLSSPALTVRADGSLSSAGSAAIASYRFDFGDGTAAVTTTAPTATAQHTYAAAGTYTVSLIVTDTAGRASSPATYSITVTPPSTGPTARLTVSQLSSPALTARADGSASTAGTAGPIASYRFDFGDGTAAVTTTAPTATAQHTYAAAGSYTVSLVVTDNAGNSSTPATASVTVTPPATPPTARLSVGQLSSPALTVRADGSTSTAGSSPIASYRFDFGDGTAAVTTTAPTATAQHTYAAAGTYTVSLVVTDTNGLSSSPATTSFSVTPPATGPTARLTVAQLSSPALTARADGSTSTAGSSPIASYRFDFGDGGAPVTTTAPTATAQHTYAAAGTYTVSLVVTDTNGLSSSPATASISFTAPPTIVEKRVAASADDAEESSSGSVKVNDSDLELIHDTSDQTVGMRWPGLAIPRGAIIRSAYIQFSAKESQSEVTSLTLRAQAADNPATFTNNTRDVSSRTRTTASTTWSPVAWTSGEVGANQSTPNLGAVIQEVVNRTGWASGNAIAIIVTGTGHRTAWAYDGNHGAAPLLHVEYSPNPAPTARLTVTNQSSLGVQADGSASTAGAGGPIATYRFDFGDGTAPVTTSAPTATASHTYAAAGTFTVSLIVTDTAGNTSPATASVTVGSAIKVYVGYYDTHHTDQLKTKPSPWQGASGVVFVGKSDNSSGGWDSSALRIDNLSGSTLSSVSVTVDMGSSHFALWGTNSIPAGQKLILAQTGYENFDGSDTSPAGCFGCNPNDCLTKVVSTIPVVHVTYGGRTTNYYDSGQVMNTKGADGAGCPYTGTRNDESSPWIEISPQVPAGAQVATADPGRAEYLPPPDRVTVLGLPAPNPASDAVTVRFVLATAGPVRLEVYDITGRQVKTSIDGDFEPGEYINRISLSGIPAGVYYCTLSTPHQTLHQKFVHVR
ncbi:MAG TPA: PKD domain-containing protein [Candidatus Eisenbacteria bacterium]